MTETVLAHCMTTASMWFLGAVLHAMYANVTTPATVACTALASTLLHSMVVSLHHGHVSSEHHARSHVSRASSSVTTEQCGHHSRPMRALVAVALI